MEHKPRLNFNHSDRLDIRYGPWSQMNQFQNHCIIILTIHPFWIKIAHRIFIYTNFQKIFKTIYNSLHLLLCKFLEHFILLVNVTGFHSIHLFSACQTLNGYSCVFPFEYKGTLYTSCKNGKHNIPWCSTKNDQQGRYQKWDYCNVDSCFTRKLISYSID